MLEDTCKHNSAAQQLLEDAENRASEVTSNSKQVLKAEQVRERRTVIGKGTETGNATDEIQLNETAGEYGTQQSKPLEV